MIIAITIITANNKLTTKQKLFVSACRLNYLLDIDLKIKTRKLYLRFRLRNSRLMIFFPLSINKSAKLSLLSNQTPTNWPYISNIQKVCQLGSNYQCFSSDNRSQILKIISHPENDPTITKCQKLTKNGD
jgi:hypothetical protein